MVEVMQSKWIVDLSHVKFPQTAAQIEILEAGRPNISEGLTQPNDQSLQGSRMRVILFN